MLIANRAAMPATTEEIVFIDAGVSDIELLRAGLRSGIEAVLLGAARPALAQMADELRHRRDIAAIHVIAHGAPGRVGFASGSLSLATVEGHADDLATIGRALAQDGEIRLWACAAAQGRQGRAFMAGLADATGARVRGSSGLVGAAARGGRWQLDGTAGEGSLPPLTPQAVVLYPGVLDAVTITITDPLIDSNQVTAVPFTVTGDNILGGSATFIDNLGNTISVPFNAGTVDLSSFTGRYVSCQVNGAQGSGPNVTFFAVYGNTTILATSPNLVLLINQFQTIDPSEWQGNPAYTSVTVKDTPASFGLLDGNDFLGMQTAGVTAIGSNTGTLTLTVDQFENLGSIGVVGPAVIRDPAAHIAAMTTGDFVSMAGKGIKALQYTDSPLTLTVDQYSNLGGVKLPTDHSTTLSDAAASFAGLSTVGLYAAGVRALIAATDVTFTAAQAKALGKVTVSATSVTLADSGAAIAALTATQLGTLAGAGFTNVDASDDALTLSVAQFQAIGAVALAAGDVVTLKDSWTNISALDLSTLGARNVDFIYATNGSFSISTAQYSQLLAAGVDLTGPAVATLTGLGSDIAGLDLSSLAANGISKIDASDNQLSLTVDQYTQLNGVQLSVGDLVTLADTSSNIGNLTAGQIGGLAASRIDQIDVSSPGGALSWSLDKFSALGTVLLKSDVALALDGAGGSDTIAFSRQTFSAADTIDGEGGTDTLALTGNYNLTFAADTIANVEKLKVYGGGHGYGISENDGNVAANQTLIVAAVGFGAGDSLVFDGSAETDGSFSFTGGGAGSTSTFTGGNKADTFTAGAGADTIRYTSAAQSNSTAYDTVNGFDSSADSFFWNQAVTFDGTVSGVLRTSTFDDNLARAFGEIAANHAMIFQATGGNMYGQVFLLINDGTAGYQTGDLIVRLSGTNPATVSSANFTHS